MEKPTKLLVSGIVLFVGGIIASFILAISAFLPFLTREPDTRLLIPGSMEIKIESAGRYYLWNCHQTVYQGKTYSKSEDIPDNLTISLKTKDGGSHVDIIGHSSITMSFDSSSQKSIGYFDIAHPGDYILDVQGESEPRVFSFGRLGFSFATLFLTMFIGMSLCFLMSTVGFVLGVIGVVGIVKRFTSKRSGQHLEGKVQISRYNQR